MNTKIESLLTRLEELEKELTVVQAPVMAIARDVKAELKREYFKVFDADKALQGAIAAVEECSEVVRLEYGADDHGVYAWVRYYIPDEYKTHETSDALDEYLSDRCIYLEKENTRHDNGVYLDQKCVIDESEYRDESGEVDVEKRNALIEAWMEHKGEFPGVFRIDYHGNVFPVNTTKPVKS